MITDVLIVKEKKKNLSLDGNLYFILTNPYKIDTNCELNIYIKHNHYIDKISLICKKDSGVN